MTTVGLTGSALLGIAIWFGALLLVGLTEIGVTAAPAALAAGAFVLLGRLLALRYDLTLPTYSARL